MKTNLLLDWLLSDVPVIGAEGEGAGEGGDDNSQGSQEGQDDSGDDDEGDADDDDEETPGDLDGLKKALAAERKLNKQKDKDLRAVARREAAAQKAKEADEKSNFIDAADAIEGVDWESLEVEQDDDDPSIVTIDAKKVLSQVKALA